MKSLLKKLSDAHKVGIISDKLTYSVDQSFTEINYSYGKNRYNKYFDCIVFINKGNKARLCYLPDTDEYSTNGSDNYIKEALIKNTNGTDSTDSSVYQFNMDEDPTSDMQVATKQYVDKNSTKIDETLTTEQKATIRDNINAIGYDPIEIPCDTGTIPFIYMIDGTFTPLAEDADEELKTAYTSFVQFIKLSTSLTNLPVKIAQNMVKSFSKMCDNGIISSSFYFCETDRFDKSIKYERTEEDGKKVDTLYYDFRMRYTAVSYYPETDTFDTNPNYKEEQPLLSTSDNNGKNFATKQFAMKSDPTENMEIATKQYVDNNLHTKMTIRQALPEDVTNLDYFNKSGMYYGHNQDGRITGMPFNDGDFILLIYADEQWDTNGQYFFNGNLCTQILIKCGQLGASEHIYVRATNFNEMGNMIHHGWTDLTSSSIMYIHVTLEEKDGETVCKSDKTYKEIKEAVDSGKSPVAIYRDTAFFTLDANMTGEVYVFTNSILGVIGITVDHDNNNTVAMCQGIPPYVTVTWSVNNMDIDVQIENDALTNLPTDIVTYCQVCQEFGKNPAIKLCVRKTNGIDLSYDVFLYYTGNDFAGTTFINGNLMYCRLTMENRSDTSTWDYTETEIPKLYASGNSIYISSNNPAECRNVFNDEDGILYTERSVKYYDTMDKVCTNNTIYGNIAIVKSKGNSDIDIPYPAIVYSTSVNSHGIFDGWIVDACGNWYSCWIGGSKVTIGELMIRGLPQPSENDANKVLYGDMTWKDATNITDEHINTLIDRKLGVIENGTY